MGDILLMSKKEVDRLTIIRDLKLKRLSQKDAGKLLHLSDRQIRRLLKRYKKEGEMGLISRKRGKVSNNKISEKLRQSVLTLISEQYYGFGPTLATEKLDELHNIVISRETVRQIMIAENIWKSKVKKEKRAHQMRERRSRFGELVQIDGSPHDWFEGRRPRCNLTVFIDDATGEFMSLFFSETETTEAYMETMQTYISEYGIPRALYADKHGIFRVNKPDPKTGNNLTQFGRAMKTLEIELVSANTPQAKGRVERANQLLQDRLVKELRLRKIDTMEEANEFLKEYKEILSNKFAVKPRSSENAHRDVLHTKDELDIIFSKHTLRIISKNLEIQYRNTIYQIQTESSGLSMRKGHITVCESFDGEITLLYKGKKMKYKTFRRQEKQLLPQDAKTLNRIVDQIIIEQNRNLGYKHSVDLFSNCCEQAEEMTNET